jgi:NADH dehydrogenase
MKIVVVGGGFAGVKATLELAKRHVGKITLVSDESYFLHHATLYATATGKNIAESVIALSDIFIDYPDVTVVKDTLVSIDKKRKLLVGKKDHYAYDAAVLALGAVTTFFGVKGLDQHAYGIKSLDEIQRFKEHIHTELTEHKLDKEYFVIGAGSTGVELAGALQEYLRYLKEAYRLNGVKTRVTIVEAAPRILPNASVTASRLVAKRLKKLGIRVLVSHKVDALTDDHIMIEGKKVKTTTAVWTAGVANNSFYRSQGDAFSLSPRGLVEVNHFLEASPSLFVIGDNNTAKYSGSAWPALDQALFVAQHLVRVIARRPVTAFRPRKAPFGLPVGEKWGYVEWKGLYVSGRSGFVARRYLELYGFKQLLPHAKAVTVWRAHDLPQVDA